jgi:hypothetical protein
LRHPWFLHPLHFYHLLTSPFTFFFSCVVNMFRVWLSPSWFCRTLQWSSSCPIQLFIKELFIISKMLEAIPVMLIALKRLQCPTVLTALSFLQFWEHRNNSLLSSWDKWWTQGKHYPLCIQDMISL